MATPVVFDCMVFLQAAARRDSIAAACLELAENGHVHLCLSEEILAEVGNVLKRPEIRAKFPSLTDALVEEFIAAVRRFGHLHMEVGKHFSFPRDPKDEPYLNLAIEAKAKYLASRDRDILELRDSSDAAAIEFRKQFPDIHIMDPLEFLQAMRAEFRPG